MKAVLARSNTLLGFNAVVEMMIGNCVIRKAAAIINKRHPRIRKTFDVSFISPPSMSGRLMERSARLYWKRRRAACAASEHKSLRELTPSSLPYI